MDELNKDTVVTETEPTVPDGAQTKDILEETYQEMSPIRLVMRRFFRSKLSLVGLIMVVFLFLFSFLGPVVYNRWGEETRTIRRRLRQCNRCTPTTKATP